MNRREFLMAGGAFLLAEGCRCPLCGGGRKLVAAQLWNCNKILWDDPAKHLAALKAGGFDGVEFAGYAKRGEKPKTAKEIAKLLADAGLKGAGAHVNGVENWTGDGLKRNLDFCAEAGIESYTLPWYKTEGRENWDKFIAMMNTAAEAADAYGIRVGFHNHFHEFEQRIGDEFVWDYVYRNASPLLCQQVDTAQAVKSGVDPLELLKRYPTRNWYVHVKENYPMASRPNDPTTPVDLKGVADWCNADPNFRWYILEDERDQTSLGPTLALAKKFLPYV